MNKKSMDRGFMYAAQTYKNTDKLPTPKELEGVGADFEFGAREFGNLLLNDRAEADKILAKLRRKG